jgi:hypothetical protein
MSRPRREIDQRIALSLRFAAGKDDDLVAWLEQIPPGQRSMLVKDILRRYVREGETLAALEAHVAQIGQDTTALLGAIQALPAQIQDRLSGAVIPMTTAASSPSARAGQLSTEGVTRREKRLSRATW